MAKTFLVLWFVISEMH